MTTSPDGPEAGLPAASPSPPHITHGQDQEPVTRQREIEKPVLAHMPRVPPATTACPHPLTLGQLIEWKNLWAKKDRPSTQSERDDYSECDRQFLDSISETTDESDYSEDGRIQLRRNPRRSPRRRPRPLSPPHTPPYLQGPKLYQNRDIGLAPQIEGSKVEKTKSKSRPAPRRPYTRSHPAPAVSLHYHKGQIVYWRLPWVYCVISFDEYLKNFEREALDKQPWEPMNFFDEDPRYPKTPYQREVCRRWTAQKNTLARVGETQVSTTYKGHT